MMKIAMGLRDRVGTKSEGKKYFNVLKLQQKSSSNHILQCTNEVCNQSSVFQHLEANGYRESTKRMERKV